MYEKSGKVALRSVGRGVVWVPCVFACARSQSLIRENAGAKLTVDFDVQSYQRLVFIEGRAMIEQSKVPCRIHKDAVVMIRQLFGDFGHRDALVDSPTLALWTTCPRYSFIVIPQSNLVMAYATM